jgi:hypothetical protein
MRARLSLVGGRGARPHLTDLPPELIWPTQFHAAAPGRLGGRRFLMGHHPACPDVQEKEAGLSRAAALALWATAYVGLGFVLSGQVTSAVNWLGGFTGISAAVAATLVLGAVLWRHVRAQMHREPHRRMAGSPLVSGTFPAPDMDAA